MLEKIEELFNLIFGFIAKFIKIYLIRLIPAPIKNLFAITKGFFTSVNNKVSSKMASAKDKINQAGESIIAATQVEKPKSETTEEGEEGEEPQGPGLIGKIKLVVAFIGRQILAYLKSKWGIIKRILQIFTLAKIGAFLGLYLHNYKIGFKTWLASLTPNTIAFGSGLLIVSATALTTMIQSGQNIYFSSIKRQPASIAPISARPVYYKGEKKLLEIKNIKMAIYRPEFKDMRMLTIDVTIKASNRNIVRHLLNREHILRDILIDKIEPILPSFTLLPEGKGILKARIQKIVNEYIEQNKIEGQVDDIYIEYLMGV